MSVQKEFPTATAVLQFRAALYVLGSRLCCDTATHTHRHYLGSSVSTRYLHTSSPPKAHQARTNDRQRVTNPDTNTIRTQSGAEPHTEWTKPRLLLCGKKSSLAYPSTHLIVCGAPITSLYHHLKTHTHTHTHMKLISSRRLMLIFRIIKLQTASHSLPQQLPLFVPPHIFVSYQKTLSLFCVAWHTC